MLFDDEDDWAAGGSGARLVDCEWLADGEVTGTSEASGCGSSSDGVASSGGRDAADEELEFEVILDQFDEFDEASTACRHACACLSVLQHNA